MKVLIAEDDRTSRALLQGSLLKLGYEVVEAANGPEALDAVSDLLPDLVLLAGELRELSGYDVYRRLKMSDRTRAIPVLLLTAVTDSCSFPTRTLPSPEFLVSKPFSAHDLLQRVAKALADVTPACP